MRASVDKTKYMFVSWCTVRPVIFSSFVKQLKSIHVYIEETVHDVSSEPGAVLDCLDPYRS